MNPDINRDGTTVSTLMLWETIGSVGIPIVSLIIAGIIISLPNNDHLFSIYVLAGLAVFILAVDVPLNTDRKSTRLNSSHITISYAVFCLKKKKKKKISIKLL